MALKPPKLDGVTLKLSALAVQQLVLEANALYQPSENGGDIDLGGVGIHPRVLRFIDNPLKRQVTLQIQVGSRPMAPTLPYYLAVVMMADVEFSALAAESDLDQSAAWFAVSPLVGGVRSYLDLVSAISPFGRFLLPPMSTDELVKHTMLVEGPDRVVPLIPESERSDDI